MPRLRALAAFALLSLALLFCTLSPTPGGGSIGGSDRIGTLDDLAAVAQTLLGPEGTLDRAGLLAEMRARNEFRAAGESPDGTLWAQFSDGRLVVVPLVALASTLEGTPTPPTAGLKPGLAAPAADLQALGAPQVDPRGQAPAPAMQSGQDANLPDSDVALLMRAVGEGFVDETWFINEALNKWKYRSSIVDASVDNLLTMVQDVGVFYFNTHGGQACKGTPQDCETVYTPAPYAPKATAWKSVAWTYALSSSTRVSEDLDRKYAANLGSGELAYSLAIVQAGGPLVWSYAITSEFIAAHFRFSDNSLVVLDACGGAAGGLEPALAEAHASVFVGWTAPTTIGQTTRFFFDRLLGINGTQPVAGFPRAKPKNRPFDYPAVMAAMHKKGLDTIPAGGDMKVPATLVAQHLQGSFQILRPTIERMTVDEEDSTLTLTGVFGDQEGEVFIGGQQVEAEWASDEIRATLGAADEADGSGEVYVKVGEHESNRVPLTLWHVEFTYTEGPEQTITAYQWLYLDVYWRADVHPYRTQPDEPVEKQEEIQLEPADGSSGRWSCSWSGELAGVSFTTTSGEGELPFTREAGAVGFTSDATLDAEARSISHLQFFVNYDTENTCIVKASGAGATIENALGFVLLPSILEEINADAPMTGPLTLDSEWKLTGARRDLMHDGMWPWLEWTEAAGEPKPDPEATAG